MENRSFKETAIRCYRKIVKVKRFVSFINFDQAPGSVKLRGFPKEFDLHHGVGMVSEVGRSRVHRSQSCTQTYSIIHRDRGTDSQINSGEHNRPKMEIRTTMKQEEKQSSAAEVAVSGVALSGGAVL